MVWFLSSVVVQYKEVPVEKEVVVEKVVVKEVEVRNYICQCKECFVNVCQDELGSSSSVSVCSHCDLFILPPVREVDIHASYATYCLSLCPGFISYSEMTQVPVEVKVPVPVEKVVEKTVVQVVEARIFACEPAVNLCLCLCLLD